MAHPAGAEVQDAAAGREGVRVVVAERADGVVVDVRDEAGRGVEIRVRGLVLALEVARRVGEGGVSGVVAEGRVGGGGGRGGTGAGRGCHSGEEGGEGEREEGAWREGAREVHC